MKKILVPVDGSEYADKAAEKAVELAKRYGAEISIMNVAQPFSILLGFKSVEEMKADAENIAKKTVEKLKKQGVKARALGVIGDPADEIVKFAGEGKYDLIVMGSKGLTESQRFLVGSVTQKVVEYSPCSVLVVKL
ncbi:MAG: universal stress protein [Methanobacteriota archaeon]